MHIFLNNKYIYVTKLALNVNWKLMSFKSLLFRIIISLLSRFLSSGADFVYKEYGTPSLGQLWNYVDWDLLWKLIFCSGKLNDEFKKTFFSKLYFNQTSFDVNNMP